MQKLKDNLHIVMFVLFSLALVRLQFSNEAWGWPFQAGPFLWVNVFPAIVVLSLAMMPFGYAAEKTTSIGAFFLLTTSAAIASVLVSREYLTSLQGVDSFLVVFLVTMMVFGLLSICWRFVKANVTLPEFRSRESSRD